MLLLLFLLLLLLLLLLLSKTGHTNLHYVNFLSSFLHSTAQNVYNFFMIRDLYILRRVRQQVRDFLSTK